MIEEQYQASKIEAHIQSLWEEKQIFKASENFSLEKFYCLAMFPYPSGKLHMGHVRNYTLADVIARHQRLLGKNVLQPMGWDAFGLPAENAARENKTAPAKWTRDNIKHMRAQMKSLGFSYDWSREFASCDPEYYRWEQWLFIKLYEKGLIYRKNAVVNWDPVDETVLANEQVIDGRGWRSGALVEQREIPQWFIKITDYADELLDDLEKLENWPEQVRTMQKNWIGRSEGLRVFFNVAVAEAPISVFTTRADTLFGITYIALAPEHELAKLAAKDNPAIEKFLDECKHRKVSEADIATAEKKGIDTGLTATHPLTGEQLPLWVTNYVIFEYGSGAVMAVPAHDTRDHEFAKLYNLPISPVISSEQDWDYSKAAYTQQGTLINSQNFDGMSIEESQTAIADTLEEKKLGKRETNYRLRDWGVSRQRYWGAPIPIIFCESCGAVPVPEEELPVILPEDIEIPESGSALKQSPEFYQTTCPKCSNPAKRETDTFDTFMESSWYFARFACSDQNKEMLDDRAKYWAPVDQYVGGIEHAVLHLLYARFFFKVLRDLGYFSSSEPFNSLLTQGMVLKDGSKMSKSVGNTVDPKEIIKKYGADTARFFIIFAAPPEQSLEWSEKGIEGAHRFLKRLWNFAYQQQNTISEENIAKKACSVCDIHWDGCSCELKKLRREIYSALKQATFDMQRLQFNTVVSACMKLLNALQEVPNLDDSAASNYLIWEGISILLRILNPICPHITHTLYRQLGFGTMSKASWPKVNNAALKLESIEMVLQVNGKRRGTIEVAADADNNVIERCALVHDNVKKYIDEKPVKKIVIVPKKLVNIVVGDT